VARRKKKLKWIASAGGPLIFVRKELVRAWRGIYVEAHSPEEADDVIDGVPFVIHDDFDFDNPRSDYERACAVKKYIEAIPCGDGRALILGDEPMQTCWWPLPDGGALLRWHHADSEADVINALADVDKLKWKKEKLVVDGGAHYLFDSAEPGARASQKLKIDLAAGMFDVMTIENHQPTSTTSLTLHRLRRRTV
jgi:hypothetical protein